MVALDRFQARPAHHHFSVPECWAGAGNEATSAAARTARLAFSYVLGLLSLCCICSAVSRSATLELHSSLLVTSILCDHILSQDYEYGNEIITKQLEAKTLVRQEKNAKTSADVEEVCELLPASLRRAVDLVKEKGSSTWLTALPLVEHGFALHKGAFHDALALRYGWTPYEMPSTCTCGSKFLVEHALSCAKGGFPTIRHNEIRNLTVTLLTEVCHDVFIEPRLQPMSNETLAGSSANRQDGARLDIAASGFWGGTFERTFFDFRVFNPHAPSNRHTQLSSCYRKHEQVKKRAYEQRIREVEHTSFTPLVISATGGLASEASTFYKRLASLLASTLDHPYSSTLCWLHCSLAYCLLRSTIQSIRGARSSCGHAIKIPTAIDLANVESNISPDVELTNTYFFLVIFSFMPVHYSSVFYSFHSVL